MFRLNKRKRVFDMKKSRVAMLVVGALVLGLTLGGLGIATAGTGTKSPTPVSTPQAMMWTSAPVVTNAVPSSQTTAPTGTAKKHNTAHKAAHHSKAKAHYSTTSHQGSRHYSSYTGTTKSGSTSTHHRDCCDSNYSGGHGGCGW